MPRPSFVPPAIPSDLAERLIKFHGQPSIWWTSQLTHFIFTPKPETEKMFEEVQSNIKTQMKKRKELYQFNDKDSQNDKLYDVSTNPNQTSFISGQAYNWHCQPVRWNSRSTDRQDLGGELPPGRGVHEVRRRVF